MWLRILQWSGWLAYLAGCLLILDSSWADYGPNGMGIFIEQKGSIGESPLWRASLHLHVAAGLICLFSALGQFSHGILRRLPALHRIAGRVYVLSILIVLTPTGFHLALYAKGGLLGKLGFLTLAVATFHTTLAGLRAVLPPKRHLKEHRSWMIRSFALAASAISFRVFHIIGFTAGLDDRVNYVGALWLSLVVNLAVAEAIIRAPRLTSPSLQLQTEP